MALAIEDKTTSSARNCLLRLKPTWTVHAVHRYNPGEPVNQWQELNHSLRWSVLRSGRRAARSVNIERCPEPRRRLPAGARGHRGAVPERDVLGARAEDANPATSRETNARLVAHLPLIVPESA